MTESWVRDKASDKFKDQWKLGNAVSVAEKVSLAEAKAPKSADGGACKELEKVYQAVGGTMRFIQFVEEDPRNLREFYQYYFKRAAKETENSGVNVQVNIQNYHTGESTPINVTGK